MGIIRFADEKTFVSNAVEKILSAAHRAIADHGSFHIVLAGGNTPRKAYQLLGEKIPSWHGWHFWFGDERCLPEMHPDLNSSMARQAFESRVRIPDENFHTIPVSPGPEAAARSYAKMLRKAGRFDLVILGLGEDGHIASLFSYETAGFQPDSPDVIFTTEAPKPPPARVSLTIKRLLNAREILMLVSGAEKNAVMESFSWGEKIPAKHLASAQNLQVYFFPGAA